jgi:hypothetical protein
MHILTKPFFLHFHSREVNKRTERVSGFDYVRARSGLRLRGEIPLPLHTQFFVG